MSIWAKICDWILGAEYMTTDEFTNAIDNLKESITTELDKLPAMIDSDNNGRISVRESIALIKSIFNLFKQYVKVFI